MIETFFVEMTLEEFREKITYRISPYMGECYVCPMCCASGPTNGFRRRYAKAYFVPESSLAGVDNVELIYRDCLRSHGRVQTSVIDGAPVTDNT